MHSRVTISLAALKRNYLRLCARIQPAAAAAVVKADAYGTGMSHVAPILYEAGCRTFYVAWPEEGIALRRILGADALIAVFYGLDADTLEDFRRSALEPVCSTLKQVQLCLNAKLKGRLQLETGMHRSGLMPEDWHAAANSGFAPALIFSHLACSDTPPHPLNTAQAAALRHAQSLWPDVPFGLAASSGSYADSAFVFDEVRFGAALYGGMAAPDIEQVVTVSAPILEVRNVQKGDAVGYGATFTASAPRRIATIGYGYADGYPRNLGNKSIVRISGASCPVIGRVSMDLITADVTGIQELGSSAQIYGEGYTILDAAAASDTIGYELLTRLGKRSKWVYEQWRRV